MTRAARGRSHRNQAAAFEMKDRWQATSSDAGRPVHDPNDAQENRHEPAEYGGQCDPHALCAALRQSLPLWDLELSCAAAWF
jgi:hypothetical protein